MNDIVKGITVPTETIGTTEPLQTEAVKYVVTLKEPTHFYVGSEQVINSFKEHNDQKFPWIDSEVPHNHNDKPFPYEDKPLQNMTDFIGCSADEPPRAIRHDEGKPHMDLLSPIAMFGTAQVLTHGLKKYPGSQWKKGMAWSKVTASLLRHLFKFMAGEDYDFDSNCEGCQKKDCKDHSGLPHVDSIATNAMFLQEYFRKHKGLDDRIKTGLE